MGGWATELSEWVLVSLGAIVRTVGTTELRFEIGHRSEMGEN